MSAKADSLNCGRPHRVKNSIFLIVTEFIRSQANTPRCRWPRKKYKWRKSRPLCDRGIMVVIDYGYTRSELLAGRHRGTIDAFRRHSMSANPYEAPGEQDVTAHVNFTALAAAAGSEGMHRASSGNPIAISSWNRRSTINSPTLLRIAVCRRSAPKSSCSSNVRLDPQAWEKISTSWWQAKEYEQEAIESLSGLSFGHRTIAR